MQASVGLLLLLLVHTSTSARSAKATLPLLLMLLLMLASVALVLLIACHCDLDRVALLLDLGTYVLEASRRHVLLASRHPRTLPQVEQIHDGEAYAQRQGRLVVLVVDDALQALEVALHLGGIRWRVQALANGGEKVTQAGDALLVVGLSEQALDAVVHDRLGDHVELEHLANEADVAERAALGLAELLLGLFAQLLLAMLAAVLIGARLGLSDELVVVGH